MDLSLFTDYVNGWYTADGVAHVKSSILFVFEIDCGPSAIGAIAPRIDCIDHTATFANIQLEKVTDTQWHGGERDVTMAIEHRHQSKFD